MLPPNYNKPSLAALCIHALTISTVLIGISMNSAMAKSSDTPISFTKGTITSVITGKLASHKDDRWYRFAAVVDSMP